MPAGLVTGLPHYGLILAELFSSASISLTLRGVLTRKHRRHLRHEKGQGLRAPLVFDPVVNGGPVFSATIRPALLADDVEQSTLCECHGRPSISSSTAASAADSD
jgi:hypothetical protein